MTKRALTDEQNAIADKVMGTIAPHAPEDAFAAFASIMAATINHNSADLEEAMARGEMWGQRFVDLLVEGRSGAFDTVGGPKAIDARYIL
ncbi:MAG: hypothetical protein KI789_00080 [Hoeflea sp.]|nr:hypothetical protein [Hoeflea sp.]